MDYLKIKSLCQAQRELNLPLQNFKGKVNYFSNRGKVGLAEKKVNLPSLAGALAELGNTTYLWHEDWINKSFVDQHFFRMNIFEGQDFSLIQVVKQLNI